MERRTLIIGVTAVLFVGLILGWALLTKDGSLSTSLVQITDKNEIGQHVEVSNVGILTGENYVGHKIRVITGNIKNISDKPLRQVDMKMVFMDYDGKPIQESVEHGHDVTQKPLPPGSQRRFEVNFENLPRGWNYHIPNIEVVKIAY
jgi:hypothetical protein